PLSSRARSLEERIRDWLRREAVLGGAVLLCVALLGIFAGSRAPSGAPASRVAARGSSSAVGSQPPPAGPPPVTLQVTPARFGRNDFIVTVADAKNQPVNGAVVVIAQTSLDMDMGTQSVQLKAADNVPGEYSTQADLTMGGHWQIDVKIIPPNAQ